MYSIRNTILQFTSFQANQFQCIKARSLIEVYYTIMYFLHCIICQCYCVRSIHQLSGLVPPMHQDEEHLHSFHSHYTSLRHRIS